MRNIGIGILILCVLLLLMSELNKRKVVAKLHMLLEKHQFKEYLELLNSPFVKFVFPLFNRRYMKLNAALMMEDHDEAMFLFKELLAMRMNQKQRKDVVLKAFSFALEQDDFTLAETLLKEIETFEELDIRLECRQMFDIIASKSTAYIDEMETRLSTMEGINKSMLHYLLALQYENKGDLVQSEKHLARSQAELIPHNQ